MEKHLRSVFICTVTILLTWPGPDKDDAIDGRFGVSKGAPQGAEGVGGVPNVPYARQ